MKVNKIITTLGLSITLALGVGVAFTSHKEIEPLKASETSIYLKAGVWDVDGAWFAAYIWNGSGNNWIKLTDNGDGYYVGSIDIFTYPNVSFVRMNPATSEFDWDYKWNQTSDLTFPSDKDCYEITGWGASDGQWIYHPDINLLGKKVSLIGDSITTYSGYLPSGNATRYPRGVITNVNQTWWKQLIDQTGLVLGQNCAWDGSTCIGRSTSTTSAYGACSAKIISQLGLNGTPDIIICFIGINDWGAYYNKTGTQYGSPFVNQAFVPVGTYTGGTPVPSGDLQTFSEAYGSMIYNIKANYPDAKVYCCTLLHTNGYSNYRYDADGVAPSINRNGVSLASYNECITTLANNMGAGLIDFANCGIDWTNLTTYMEDGLHPNVAGMKLLSAKAKAQLEADFAPEEEYVAEAKAFAKSFNESMEDACSIENIDLRENQVKSNWGALAGDYSDLTYEAQEFLKSDTTFDVIASFREKYDSIYSIRGTMWRLSNFLEREYTSKLINPISNSNTMVICVICSLALVSNAGLCFYFVRKRKRK